jgi:hypothetical protein
MSAAKAAAENISWKPDLYNECWMGTAHTQLSWHCPFNAQVQNREQQTPFNIYL